MTKESVNDNKTIAELTDALNFFTPIADYISQEQAFKLLSANFNFLDETNKVLKKTVKDAYSKAHWKNNVRGSDLSRCIEKSILEYCKNLY